jgi:Sulfatase
VRPARRLLLAVLAAGLAAASGPGAAAARAASRAPARHPPVVMLMFDEFETSALFDTHGHIDPVRYPHLAALAGTATVYRRFTAAGDITGPASGSLLASQPYALDKRGVLADFPKNIFTLFRAAGYGLTVREAATNLCPRCPGDHAPRSAQDVLSALTHGRVARYEAWLRALRRTARPTLAFDHLLLPHGPQQFSPSGHRYRDRPGEAIPGLNGTPSFGDPWLVRQGEQRYLMQMELVDALVGRLEARLRAIGLWDRAVVVLTADNGEGWGHLGSDPHRIDRRTVSEIVQTPLILKQPGQRRGGYSDRRVRTIDLLPTLGRLAHVGVGRVAGRPFVGPGANRIPAAPIVALDDLGHRYELTPRAFAQGIRASIRRRIGVFGQHTRDLFAIGPSPGLLGRPVSALRVGSARGYGVGLEPRDALRHVSFRHSVVPSQLTGVLRGPRARRRMPFAIAVNGRIAATGRTARLAGSRRIWVSAMIPESSLRAGANTVEVFLLDGGTLRRVRGG